MSINSFSIDLNDLADLINFDNIGDELQKSGISINTKNSLANATPIMLNMDDINKESKNPINPSSSTQTLSLHDLPMDKLSTQTLSLQDLQKDKLSIQDDASKKIDDKCTVCYNIMYMKVKLPCNHEFCLSCIKGIVIRVHRSQKVKCPLCNAPLPDALKYKIKNKPHLLSSLKIDENQLNDLDVYWFYSGRDRGWWAYDIQHMIDIEDIYQKYINGESIDSINTLTICGMLFDFDFDNMKQSNQSNGGRRNIKRVEKHDIAKFQKSGSIKGMAGVSN